MNHLSKITISVLLLLFLGTNLTFSQNEKLWEFNIGPKRVTDVDFYNDESFCYTNYKLDIQGELIEGSYKFTIRNINDTSVIREINLHHSFGHFELSKGKDLILISVRNRFYFYSYDVELLDSLYLPNYTIEGTEKYKEYIVNFSVDFDNNKLVVLQRKQNNKENAIKTGQTWFTRILIYDLQSKQLIHTIDGGRSEFKGVKISPNGRYICASEDNWPAKVRIFDATTFEHIWNAESKDNPVGEKENFLDHFTFSPDGNYLANRFSYNKYTLIIFDLKTREIIHKGFEGYTKFLTNNFILTRTSGLGAEIYSFPDMSKINSYPPRVGADVHYNSDNFIILSRSNSIITGARFNPSILSVEENEENTVNTYPQPSTGIFNIEFTVEKSQNYSYSVFNETGTRLMDSGKQFYNSGQNQLQVDLSNYPSGVYFLELQPSIGTTFKLVKE